MEATTNTTEKKENQKEFVPISNEDIDKLMSGGLLAQQSYQQIKDITPVSKFVMSRQATLNIGTIGHVAHGKSTLVRTISGVHTVRFKEEKVRNITIRLGYANAKIFQCPKCPPPICYYCSGSDALDDQKCNQNKCGETMELVRHVSFVDCPGHDILMSTMLTGAAVMDAALLLIAGNMPCPQPQTQEHLAAIDIMKLEKIIIIQNKLDIVLKSEGAAEQNFEQIKNFVRGTKAENSPIIPCSAQLNYNVDAVCQYIHEYIPMPSRQLTISPQMMIIRSFDVNKPGFEIERLQGGVVGGSILNGILKVGDVIEIRPGNYRKIDKQNECIPIRSRIVSLNTEKNQLLYAVPGGLIGVGLQVDPSLTRNDKLVGNLLGYPGELPEIYMEIEIEFKLLRKLIGVKSEAEKQIRIEKCQRSETLRFNIGSRQTGGTILDVKDNNMRIELIKPICTQIGEQVAFSRKIENKWRLIGWGSILNGSQVDVVEN